MLTKQSILLIFLFLWGAVYSQDTIQNSQSELQTIEFTSFGVNPTKVSKDLLEKIEIASSFEEKAEAIQQLANFHMERGNVDSIVYYGKYLYEESLQEREEIVAQDYYLSISANILAIGKRKQGLTDEALKWHIKGVAYAENIKDTLLVNRHKFGIGITHFLRDEYPKAIALFMECLDNTTNQALKHDIYKRLGDVYLLQGKLTDAQQEYVKAEAFFASENMYKKKLEASIQLGVVAEQFKDVNTAFSYFNSVKEEALKNEFYDLYFNAQNRIGRHYYNLKQYQNAQIALTSAYANAVQWNHLESQKNIIENLELIYLKLKDYKNAYAIMTQYVDVSNRILKNQNKKEVNELEVQYNTLQKENQINILENEQTKIEGEIEHQKILKMSFLIGFLIVLIPVIGLLYMYYQKLQTQSELNVAQEEVNQQKVATLLKDQELKLIKADIDGQDKERKRIAQELHDNIGGSLAGIKLQLSNIAQSDENYKRIASQIDETYNQVRDLSHTLIPKKFNENIFTVLIAHYIDNLQKDNKTKIIFSPHPEKEINAIDETLKVELFKIIKELMTNVFKHAKANQITIHLNKYEDSIKLLFEDDGVGFDMKKHKKGIGLTNIKSRLEALSGTMHVDSFPNRGTVIDIDMPIKT